MPRRAKPKVGGKITVNTYAVLADCVERGVLYGWNRAHHHTSTPGEETVKAEIEQAVLNEISTYFNFGEET